MSGYEQAVEILARQNGTKDNPFLVPVDPRFPERNVAGFWVQPVEKMTVELYERNGFFIRVMAEPSFENWEGSIPEDVPPELAERVVQVRRPAVWEWWWDNDHFHRRIDCLPTKVAHESTLTKIEEDETRKWLYFWLVFPEGTVLDNRVFSTDDYILEQSQIGLKVNVASLDHPHLAVYWRIATKGGNRISKKKTSTSMQDLYAD